jgi:hypothetical protein
MVMLQSSRPLLLKRSLSLQQGVCQLSFLPSRMTAAADKRFHQLVFLGDRRIKTASEISLPKFIK